MTDPDLLPTERIEVDLDELQLDIEEATAQEGCDWAEATEIEKLVGPARAQTVLERLDRAGVKARVPSSRSRELRKNRRRDSKSAARFDHAMALLGAGDLEGALSEFAQLLEARPQSTRLWIFVRALSQAKTAGE